MSVTESKVPGGKLSRLDIRLPVEMKAQIETAAQLSGVKVSEFTRRSITERAEEVITAHERTRLNPVDHATFFAAMETPKAVPNLSVAFSNHEVEVESR